MSVDGTSSHYGVPAYAQRPPGVNHYGLRQLPGQSHISASDQREQGFRPSTHVPLTIAPTPTPIYTPTSVVEPLGSHMLRHTAGPAVAPAYSYEPPMTQAHHPSPAGYIGGASASAVSPSQPPPSVHWTAGRPDIVRPPSTTALHNSAGTDVQYLPQASPVTLASSTATPYTTSALAARYPPTPVQQVGSHLPYPAEVVHHVHEHHAVQPQPQPHPQPVYLYQPPPPRYQTPVTTPDPAATPTTQPLPQPPPNQIWNHQPPPPRPPTTLPPTIPQSTPTPSPHMVYHHQHVHNHDTTPHHHQHIHNHDTTPHHHHHVHNHDVAAAAPHHQHVHNIDAHRLYGVPVPPQPMQTHSHVHVHKHFVPNGHSEQGGYDRVHAPSDAPLHKYYQPVDSYVQLLKEKEEGRGYSTTSQLHDTMQPPVSSLVGKVGHAEEGVEDQGKEARPVGFVPLSGAGYTFTPSVGAIPVAEQDHIVEGKARRQRHPNHLMPYHSGYSSLGRAPQAREDGVPGLYGSSTQSGGSSGAASGETSGSGRSSGSASAGSGSNGDGSGSGGSGVGSGSGSGTGSGSGSGSGEGSVDGSGSGSGDENGVLGKGEGEMGGLEEGRGGFVEGLTVARPRRSGSGSRKHGSSGSGHSSGGGGKEGEVVYANGNSSSNGAAPPVYGRHRRQKEKSRQSHGRTGTNGPTSSSASLSGVDGADLNGRSTSKSAHKSSASSKTANKNRPSPNRIASGFDLNSLFVDDGDLPAFRDDDETSRRGSGSNGTSSTSTSTGNYGSPVNLPNNIAEVLNGIAGPAAHSQSKYELVVRQQPVRARMIGFGERDRRPIDPPPIIELKVHDVDKDDPTKFTDAPHLIVHASLWDTSGNEERGVVINPFAPPPTPATSTTTPRTPAARRQPTPPPTSPSKSKRRDRKKDRSKEAKTPAPSIGTSSEVYSQVLVGSLVSPCHVLTDLDGNKGMFFVFSDISVRISGHFRLKFLLFNVKCPFPESGVDTTRGTVLSEPFTVYHPKEFPGMTDSTELSKCFSRQGVRIHIRSDTRFVSNDASGRRILPVTDGEEDMDNANGEQQNADDADRMEDGEGHQGDAVRRQSSGSLGEIGGVPNGNHEKGIEVDGGLALGRLRGGSAEEQDDAMDGGADDRDGVADGDGVDDDDMVSSSGRIDGSVARPPRGRGKSLFAGSKHGATSSPSPSPSPSMDRKYTNGSKKRTKKARRLIGSQEDSADAAGVDGADGVDGVDGMDGVEEGSGFGNNR
ncbi:hypothetical protein HDV00_002351 [Rhizophlyctis rosea]|nr:hypothetical protein HDV00_002351 [Rhizophlyctis rosea]